MSECALCAKPPDVTWLGGYEVGEHIICAECYDRHIDGDETLDESIDWSTDVPEKTPRGLGGMDDAE